MEKVDDKDLRLLALLQDNSKASVQQLAKQTGMPPTTVHNRIKRLEQLGIVKGYSVKVDWSKAGKPLLAHVLITFEHIMPTGGKVHLEDAAQEIKDISGVEEVSILTGTTDILAKVRAKSIEELSEVIVKKLRTVPGVDKTQTMLVLSTY